MTTTPSPDRGDVWNVTLNPTVGHEQQGTRPCLVVSVNRFNHSRAGLVVVLPLTSVDKGIISHVKVPKGQGGLREDSFIKCEELRCVSKERLGRRRGRVEDETIMSEVERNIRMILGL
jgi:mRNA interferase MazF